MGEEKIPDAIEQVLDAAIYRDGYQGPIVRHPPEEIIISSYKPLSDDEQQWLSSNLSRQFAKLAKIEAALLYSGCVLSPLFRHDDDVKPDMVIDA